MSIKTSPHPLTVLKNKHGVTRTRVHYYVYNIPAIGSNWDNDVSAALTLYKRIDIPGRCLTDYLKCGMFYFYNPTTGQYESFNIVYHHCGPVSVRNAAEITISLRVAHSDFNIEPVAMITIKGSK